MSMESTTTEVELKARVDDPEAVRRILRKRCEFAGSFVKEDTYFARRSSSGAAAEAKAPMEKKPPAAKTLFRLRRQGDESVVTYKEKRLEGSTEVNREHEFTVSDPQTFLIFVERLGFEPAIRKRKEGELFHWGKARVELSRLCSLGWFVEIERLVKGEAAEDIREAKEEIRRILKEIGIDEEQIEKRYYTDLLREKEIH